MRTKNEMWQVGIFTVVGLFLGLTLGYWVLQLQFERTREAARELGYRQGQNLSQRLNETMGAAYGLASLVRQGSASVENFDAEASELMHKFPMARVLELAPKGVVTQVFPLAGNEAVVGHDLLRDKERNREAHLSLVNKRLTLAGPVDLIQGGLGAIGRYPIFHTTPDGRNEFWGFSIVLVRVSELLANAGFLQLEADGYSYNICQVQPGGGGCRLFYSHGKAVLNDPVTIEVSVPNGKWLLSIAPQKGWLTFADWLTLVFISLAVAALLGSLQLAVLHCRGSDRASDRASDQ